MGKSKKNGFYAVRIGRKPGVYDTWAETESQVSGFPRAIHKSFPTRAEAEVFANVSFAAQADFVPFEPAKVPEAFIDVKPNARVEDTDISGAARNHASSEDTPISAPILTPEQAQILDRIILGESIFFTGPAGTGKSVLLRAIISAFKDRQSGESEEEMRRREQMAGQILSGRQYEGGRRKGWNLAVTASTGMAAVNIGGCTLHSWSGIGLGKQPVKKLHESIQRSDQTMRRWQEVDALIIDELSMIPATLLDTLSQLGRRIRKNDLPFGGIQIIASGDFYQLPPVPERVDHQTVINKNGELDDKSLFAFEADCWSNLFPPKQVITLQKVFRQSQTTFVSLLTRLRHGEVLASDIALINSCARPVEYADGVEPVSLMASKIEASTLNQRRLRELPDVVVGFTAHDSAGVNSKGFRISPSDATSVLDRQTNWERVLDLKLGALVMLLANMQDNKLVNGSTGVITDFLTIPEAQKKGIYVPERAFNANPEFAIAWPIIDFVPPPHLAISNKDGSKGKNFIRALIPKMSVSVNNAQGTAEAIRFQLPLMLAWGMTIHKSQGQSIERLRVDLSRIFEHGQTYVALSRATNLDTLEVRGFEAKKVMAHPKVIAWTRQSDRMREDAEMDYEDYRD